MKRYIIELENGVYIAPWTGDPGRTLEKRNAAQYNKLQSAKIGLANARKHRPFINARIIEEEIK